MTSTRCMSLQSRINQAYQPRLTSSITNAVSDPTSTQIAIKPIKPTSDNIKCDHVYLDAPVDDFDMNLSADALGPDVVNVSWNAKAFLMRNVEQLRLIAKPVEREALPIASALANASDCSGVIANELRPSTRYLILLEEIHIHGGQNESKMHRVEYVRTTPGGEWTKDWPLLFTFLLSRNY